MAWQPEGRAGAVRSGHPPRRHAAQRIDTTSARTLASLLPPATNLSQCRHGTPLTGPLRASLLGTAHSASAGLQCLCCLSHPVTWLLLLDMHWENAFLLPDAPWQSDT